jgi:hypothetical protein
VLGLRDRRVQVVKPPLQQPAELFAFGLAVQHRLEGLAPHVGIGHARVGELPDIGRDPVQLVERQPPRSGARAARDDERAVDVKQNRNALAGHGGSP